MLDKKKYYRNYYKNNKEKYAAYIKKYQDSPKGKKKSKEWRENNLEKRNEWLRNYEKERKKKDPTIIIKKMFLVRLRRVVKRYLETGKIQKFTIPLLFRNFDKKKLTEHERILIGFEGIDYEKIIEYLKPFPKDFLENYQIDHIIPLSKFDFNKAEDIKECFKPKNHQVLTIKQNQSKGSKLFYKC